MAIQEPARTGNASATPPRNSMVRTKFRSGGGARHDGGAAGGNVHPEHSSRGAFPLILRVPTGVAGSRRARGLKGKRQSGSLSGQCAKHGAPETREVPKLEKSLAP